MSIEQLSVERTDEEINAVTNHLQSIGGEWTAMPPDYANLSRESTLRKLDDIRKVVSQETDVSHALLDDAYERSVDFTQTSFDQFESKGKNILGREIDRAFLVPLRDGINNVSDPLPFHPVLDPGFGVSHEIRRRAVIGVAPSVIDTSFKSDREGDRGVLIFAPLFSQMIDDIRPNKHDQNQTIALMNAGAAIIRATALFAHEQVGAKVVGLGATLPKMTNYGNALKAIDPARMENLVTTTGHGGTVFMVVETIKKVLEITPEDDGKLGVIGGAGSIGWSSTVTALEMLQDRKIHTYDFNVNKLHGNIMEHGLSDQVLPEDNALDVLRNTNIIIAAATRPIDLDKEDPLCELDLTGKVIIDDSQPPCFERSQIERRGGKVVWVVGEDASESEFMTRDGLYTNGIPYNYGNEEGLYGEKSDFACGLEAAMIAHFSAFDDAIRGEVTPEKARIIGRYFTEANVRVAPLQAYSQPVQI
ncbi:hypothetical protein EON76_00135 [bacterium]|nr:MAG: hypothetical protein EON76_00135 [bacterium]